MTKFQPIYGIMHFTQKLQPAPNANSCYNLKKNKSCLAHYNRPSSHPNIMCIYTINNFFFHTL